MVRCQKKSVKKGSENEKQNRSKTNKTKHQRVGGDGDRARQRNQKRPMNVFWEKRVSRRGRVGTSAFRNSAMTSGPIRRNI